MPVLSNTTVSTSASAARELEPFTRMPRRLAPPMPPKKDNGTEMTSAQGQLTTRKVRPRRIQSAQAPMPMSGGTTAMASAAKVTMGV